MEYISLPFSILFRIPKLRLKIPTIKNPPPTIIFILLFFSYFLVISGIIYDVIVEPPSIGSSQDPATGSVKPVVFLQWRVNGQYIIEGLSAGLLFCLGGIGFIVLDKATQKETSTRNKYLLYVMGIICIVVAYNLSIVFLKIKVPGYLRT